MTEAIVSHVHHCGIADSKGKYEIYCAALENQI